MATVKHTDHEEGQWGFLGGASGNLPAGAVYARDTGSVPGLGRSLGAGDGNALQYSCLENPHGQRSLAGYGPRGRRESDTTERLSIAQHSHSVHVRYYCSVFLSLLFILYCIKKIAQKYIE